MQTTWSYPAVFQRLDDEVIVRFPDIPEALTGAATLEEARVLAADALEEAVLAYLADGRPVPAPRKAAKGEEAVILDPLTAGRAAVANLMAAQHVSKVALAARMRRDEKVVRRIVGGAGGVTMENVTAALKALGAKPALALELT
jgi:antitoxin HicB